MPCLKEMGAWHVGFPLPRHRKSQCFTPVINCEQLAKLYVVYSATSNVVGGFIRNIGAYHVALVCAPRTERAGFSSERETDMSPDTLP